MLAFAVFLSGGSLAPRDSPAVSPEPPPHICGRIGGRAMSLAVALDPRNASDLLRSFSTRGFRGRATQDLGRGRIATDGYAAARITDMCAPMVTALVPHVGGPIIPPCAITVLIREPAGCAGHGHGGVCRPPDVIALGSFTVLICGCPQLALGDIDGARRRSLWECQAVLVGMTGL